MAPDMARHGRRAGEDVICPACGRTLPREEAREYDKFGDRWDRRNKTFEYFCRSCHDDLCLQRRDELEELLCELRGDHADRQTFLRRYSRAVQQRYGRLGDR